ncbi:hypothetical protein GCWU000341_00068 [Oribacterium sp. oral taxon 078 str. F0262]|nr:hypothetical protein GCWU000341_00068 [Oribacterium sp. oral taxon 078 str. F0262]
MIFAGIMLCEESPSHEHAAGRSHAGMRMRGAGRERPSREATRESLFL